MSTPRHLLAASLLLVPALLLLSACSVGNKKPESTPGPTSTVPNQAQGTVRPAAQLQTSSVTDFTVTVSRDLRFIWPAAGAITSYFGPGHANGIDVALSPDLSPIQAAGSGTVSFAGGDSCCGLGLRVEIEHGNGIRTVYGHLSEVSVDQGEAVRQGTTIGFGGTTGDADGKHLHLEMYQDGNAVDPLRFLPSLQENANRTDRVSCAESAVRLEPAATITLRFVGANAGNHEIAAVRLTYDTPIASALGMSAVKEGLTGVNVQVPPAAAALGQNLLARLEVDIKGGPEIQTVACQLFVRTWLTLPNAPAGPGPNAQSDATGSAAAEPPTPTPAPTPVTEPQINQAAPPPPAPTRTPVTGPVNNNPAVNKPTLNNAAPNGPTTNKPTLNNAAPNQTQLNNR
jgi:hypothetical protein